jgi:hypothetical protein
MAMRRCDGLLRSVSLTVATVVIFVAGCDVLIVVIRLMHENKETDTSKLSVARGRANIGAMSYTNYESNGFNCVAFAINAGRQADLRKEPIRL